MLADFWHFLIKNLTYIFAIICSVSDLWIQIDSIIEEGCQHRPTQQHRHDSNVRVAYLSTLPQILMYCHNTTFRLFVSKMCHRLNSHLSTEADPVGLRAVKLARKSFVRFLSIFLSWELPSAAGKNLLQAKPRLRWSLKECFIMSWTHAMCFFISIYDIKYSLIFI